ncbi:hypothetical protein D9619_010348 [Psilocybe cf. subviscida]|uniref:Phosphatidylinositol-specific phospholipase C X domain-containing protein n=1 Tax=Psilocybe cf. subviscida TaxID=2480587 RepID=A0A8H5ERN5_9AGAR|nr:hypothetical protein D9619_010348 [Psilocybe cf. subviscida]
MPFFDSLAGSALAEILERGAPILGSIKHLDSQTKLSSWMDKYPDETKLVHLNLPGTHDTCTWNYTPELQESLERYTGPIPDSTIYRCQEHSIFQMLNEGIRVFDLRYAWNPGQDTIGFFHSRALLSPTTRMEDVFFGLYHWLDLHPSETVLVSLNYEPGTGTSNDARLQEHLYHILTSSLAQRYWVQAKDTLGTLGEARGKLTLIQRFDFSLLPSDLTERFGIHLGPTSWTDNGKNTEIVYNEATREAAYIEDYYQLPPSPDSYPVTNIDLKFKVVEEHLLRAMSRDYNDQLFITFASAAFQFDEPSLVPKVYAVGNKDEDLKEGVNHKLLSWLQGHQGERLGIILLDFYNVVPNLVEAIVGNPIPSRM